MGETQNEEIYDLGQIRVGDIVVPTGSFKIGYSQEFTSRHVTSQHEGSGWKKGNKKYTWSADDIEPQYYKILKEIYNDTARNGDLTVSAYNFEENGAPRETEVLYGGNINKIDFSQDKGLKVSVSGEALRNKK